MRIKTEVTMDVFEFMGRFYDHYIEEKDWAEDFIEYHTMENGHWDDRLTDVIMRGMAYDLYNFRFAFEEFADEKCEINNSYPQNLVAFVLTMEYFGIENIKICS